jgi:hypothetical protein
VAQATDVAVVCGVLRPLIREVSGSNLSTTETAVLIFYVRRRLWSRDAMVADLVLEHLHISSRRVAQ